jgi:cysteine desulfurase
VSRRIYLDFNASTPICPEAVEAMRPFLSDHCGNPSSLHWAGMPAKDAVENARGQVAGLLGCDPTEVVFTSGGSESNNHAIKGVFFANRDRGDHSIRQRSTRAGSWKHSGQRSPYCRSTGLGW